MRFIRFVCSRLFLCILAIAAIFAAIIFLCLYLHSLLPAALGAAAAYLFSLVCALFLLGGDGRGDYKCAWLALIAALPFIGAVLYVFSCAGISGKREVPVPPPLSSYESYEYFKDGARYLSRLRECVKGAKRSVYLEFYIISKGRIWGLLCEELKNALARGAEVAIIYDGLGSSSAPVKDFKKLSAMGARINVFNKPMPFPLSRLNCRNHRKIAVIDGRTVFLGGVNIADEYANITSPHGYWKDGGIMLQGDIAARYEQIFLTDFYGREEREAGAVGAREGKDGAMEGAEGVFAAENGQRIESNAARIVVDGPANINGCCEELVTAKIYSARERVCIFTPYLCVSEKLKDALIYAAGRGALVRIIIPQIPDKRITYEISLAYADELAAHGIGVYCFKPGFMHAKCVVCDGETLLGSYNFDFRSMRLNYECGIWAGGGICERAYADFCESLIICSPVKRVNSFARRSVRSALKLFAPLF